MPNRNVIIFSGLLLPASETFIRAQGEGLQQFTAQYVGTRRVKGLDLPGDRTFVVNSGGAWGMAQEGVFKLSGSASKLRQHLRHLQPALLHAHFGVCGALALPIVQSLNLPMIVTFHGLDATMKDEYARHASLTHRVYLHRREALKQQAKLFIGVSEFVKSKLIEQGFPSDRVVAHAIGIDTHSFQLDPSVPREPVVLFVGRLTEKKGCEYLIRAMVQVQSILPDVELVVIGDGLLRTELETLAKSLLRRYKFLGLQPLEMVKSWMNRAQLLAVPSITAPNGDSEGLPTVAVEAQAMGLPVVGSIHAGIPQAILHEETGLLASERDYEGLADAMLRILKDPELWQRFSLAGQTRSRAHFNLHQQNRILENLYESVIRGDL